MKMKVSLLLVALFWIGCSSTPKPDQAPSGFEKARWETKLRVKDLRNDKTQTVALDLLGERGGRLRMEASALLGIPVASYVLTGDEFKCAVWSKKKYYEGPADEKSVQTLFKIQLNPALFREIAFEQEPRGWSCRKGVSGPESCEKDGIQIQWVRNGEKKNVKIRSTQFEMDWAFNAPKTEVQFKEDSFRLEPPQGFQIIRL